MQVKEKNRREIEERLGKMGDYVKIDYLISCLKRDLDFDSKRFCLIKLSFMFFILQPDHEMMLALLYSNQL